MKATFICTEEHGGGAWRRFDFKVVGTGPDCPGGTLVLHTTNPDDFEAFKPGKTYAALFAEAKEEAPSPPAVDVSSKAAVSTTSGKRSANR